MTTSPASSLMPQIEAAVLAAGLQMLKTMASPEALKVWRKPDQSLVLNLDLESEQILLSKLKGVLPIVSEEDPSTHHLIESHGDYLLLDPLDGTTSCKRFTNQVGGQLGFGPLVGLALGGIIEAAVFFHLPRRTLFTAIRGQGTWICPLENGTVDSKQRTHLSPPLPNAIEDSAILFYPGSSGELKLIDYLRSRDMVENAYRFGGFANDCTRIASGFEQLHVQMSVHPWDYSAVLFAAEAGSGVLVDPLGNCIRSTEWKIAKSNPVLIGPPALLPQLAQHFQEATGARLK